MKPWFWAAVRPFFRLKGEKLEINCGAVEKDGAWHGDINIEGYIIWLSKKGFPYQWQATDEAREHFTDALRALFRPEYGR